LKGFLSFLMGAAEQLAYHSSGVVIVPQLLDIRGIATLS
jgi:hypothetical protein